MGAYAGLTGKLYYNNGTHGSPTWVEIKLTRDVTLGIEATKADASSRTQGWKVNLQGLKAGPLEWEIVKDVVDATYQFLRLAFLNATVVDLAVSSGPITGPAIEYFRGDYLIFGFSQKEPLDNTAMIDVKADLAYSANLPNWTYVS